ncbi:NUDIX hydrolase domain-like protein [Lasiosphaeris hirsuta]|uniref:NUDIX hydrolase domain-like protein n=1 Tax=Lasiosphaeris hirsuta TaxID=260670 RepID=A0AA40A0Z1_9PEZI|nr:NUDIX hydrolase domain-like protein [Lasiosphaeris hirsuta]
MPPLAFPAVLTPFATPPASYLAANPTVVDLVVSATVIRTSAPGPVPRVLLIQRAATDGFPLLWESPGGGVERNNDATLLHALQRELAEETGLALARVAALLDDKYEWAGGRARKITFLVEVDADQEVVLDPAEHADFVWATEAEVRDGRCDGRVLDFAYPGARELVLEAFGVFRGLAVEA